MDRLDKMYGLSSMNVFPHHYLHGNSGTPSLTASSPPVYHGKEALRPDARIAGVFAPHQPSLLFYTIDDEDGSVIQRATSPVENRHVINNGTPIEGGLAIFSPVPATGEAKWVWILPFPERGEENLAASKADDLATVRFFPPLFRGGGGGEGRGTPPPPVKGGEEFDFLTETVLVLTKHLQAQEETIRVLAKHQEEQEATNRIQEERIRVLEQEATKPTLKAERVHDARGRRPDDVDAVVDALSRVSLADAFSRVSLALVIV